MGTRNVVVKARGTPDDGGGAEAVTLAGPPGNVAAAEQPSLGTDHPSYCQAGFIIRGKLVHDGANGWWSLSPEAKPAAEMRRALINLVRKGLLSSGPVRGKVCPVSDKLYTVRVCRQR